MPLALQTFPTLARGRCRAEGAGARYLGGGTLVVRAANEGDSVISTLSCARPTRRFRRIKVDRRQARRSALR